MSVGEKNDKKVCRLGENKSTRFSKNMFTFFQTISANWNLKSFFKVH